MNSPAFDVTPRVTVYLDGVPQAMVVAFNTRANYLARYVQEENGEWIIEECVGIVHADTSPQTTQTFGSGQGTNSSSS